MYKWDPERALDLIESERVTILSVAPSMLMQLLESPDFDSRDTRSLISLGAGGAATPPRVYRLIEEKLPISYAGTGWGMTETNAIGASLTGKAFLEHPGSAGFAHPTAEIEGVLLDHPAIEEVAAIGVADERMGEELGVVVVPRAGSNLGPDDVRAYASERLAGFKVPRYVWLREEPLPRNATSKVLKAALRERYAAG